MLKYLVLLLLVSPACAHAQAPEVKELDKSAPVMIEIEEIDEEHVNAVMGKMEELKNGGYTDVWLKIDSFGGSVFDGFELIQYIENYGQPVTCVADVKAMSMGFMVLQSCDKRLMTKRATLMAHEPAVQINGNIHNLEEKIQALKVLMGGFVDSCLERMTITKEEFVAKTQNKSWYMGWEEALKVGAIDGTIKPRELPHSVKIEAKMDLNQLLKILH